jgi:hypothetical protein
LKLKFFFSFRSTYLVIRDLFVGLNVFHHCEGIKFISEFSIKSVANIISTVYSLDNWTSFFNP